MKTFGLRSLSIGALAIIFAAGCGCLSTRRVRAKVEDLRLQNRAEVEPAMLAAAKSRGATLLSLQAQDIDHRFPCANGSDEGASVAPGPPDDICMWMESNRPGCQEWASDGRTFLIRDKGENAKLAVSDSAVGGLTVRQACTIGQQAIRPDASPNDSQRSGQPNGVRMRWHAEDAMPI